jgi:copper chaperone
MKATVKIQNLKCSGCGATITNNLSTIDTVKNIEILLEEDAVRFDYENELALGQVKKTLKRLGYPEQGEGNTLGAKAKSYVSCAIGKMS